MQSVMICQRKVDVSMILNGCMKTVQNLANSVRVKKTVLMRIVVVNTGLDMENVRKTLNTCWFRVRRAVMSAKSSVLQNNIT